MVNMKEKFNHGHQQKIYWKPFSPWNHKKNWLISAQDGFHLNEELIYFSKTKNANAKSIDNIFMYYIPYKR